jgi:tetratricopeptide (TPR) repeat protein
MRIWLRLFCLLLLCFVQCTKSAAAVAARPAGDPQESSAGGAARPEPARTAPGKDAVPEKEPGWEDFLEASRKSYAAGKLKESANELDLALSAAERLKADPSKANVFLKLGEQYIYLKQFERAKVLMEEGLALKRKIPGFRSVASANALDNLAQAYSRTGNLEGACKFECEALSTYESLRRTDTHDYAIALANHANTLRQLKQNKEAEQFFARAVASERKLSKGESLELAKILLNAGGFYCETGRLDSAKRLLDRAGKIIQDKLSPEHPLYKLSTKSQRVYYKKLVDTLLIKDANPLRPEVAQAVEQLASLYDAEGDAAQAAAAYKQAISIEEQLVPADSADLQKLKDLYEVSLKKLVD